MPALHPVFAEFLSCLLEHRVKFVVVGAFALAVLGRPRATKDIDVLVEPSRENARRLSRAFATFGYTELAAQAVHHFARRDRMATVGVPPVRIDILSSITGVAFSSAWRGRNSVEVGDGLLVPFLGETEFRRAKRAAGRPQDLLDLALLDELEPQRKRTT